MISIYISQGIGLTAHLKVNEDAFGASQSPKTKATNLLMIQGLRNSYPLHPSCKCGIPVLELQLVKPPGRDCHSLCRGEAKMPE
jgi:hypothetical protein